ncbi:ras-related protein Rab-24 [Exaiptasia diaphana]|uniref:Ras-related protein Rab-24 n=1 Tax=Exaiptasia diaphana TaxID=2652724 RepID=A0A913WSX7_EXADI|nr:ras-related protein Rab-24 [Exaiptasia diaphana]KXJ18182.1 Ras-related protein Rab-24 [Exaiptasia diaphana]
MQEKTYLKVVLLGKVNSGKTCLVTRYITRAFSEETPSTIGAAFCRKDLYIQGRNLSLAIWDTAGAERYQAMSAMYYRSARAAIICYDLTDDGSFTKAKFWVDQLKDAEPECRIYLCGTKLDLIEEAVSPREVLTRAVSNYGRDIGADVFETSSKRGTNVDKVFEKIAEDFMRLNKVPGQGKGDVTLDNGSRKKISCCQ